MNGIDWIDKNKRKPTKTDEDAHGCILAWHRYTGLMVTNADNFNIYGGACNSASAAEEEAHAGHTCGL